MPTRRFACTATTGTPSRFGKRVDVDLNLPIAGQVDHVQRDDRRQAERQAPG